MSWLLLIFALVALFLGMRTPSPAMLAGWMVIAFLCMAGWLWLRYRMLFPANKAEASITPLDPVELAHLREQAQANREAEARARAEAEAEALHPIHPVTTHVLDHPSTHPVVPPPMPEPPAPEPVPERPITGRAVFVVPDDAPRVVQPGDRSS